MERSPGRKPEVGSSGVDALQSTGLRPWLQSIAAPRLENLTRFIPLPPPFHPDRNTRRENGNRQQQDEKIRHPSALSFGHGQTTVFRIFGPDRDEVLILSQPGDGVEEKVSITLRIEEPVRCKIRIA